MDVRRSEGAAVEQDSTTGRAPGPAEPAAGADSRRVREWWHRDHPTFTALAGFFTGLAYVALVPALFGTVLNSIFGERAAREAFPFVVLLLALPLVLLVADRTRRFGKYMVVGMVVTAIVVVGVSWAVASLLVWQGR